VAKEVRRRLAQSQGSKRLSVGEVALGRPLHPRLE
jgi:hypothetical protein